MFSFGISVILEIADLLVLLIVVGIILGIENVGIVNLSFSKDCGKNDILFCGNSNGKVNLFSVLINPLLEGVLIGLVCCFDGIVNDYRFAGKLCNFLILSTVNHKDYAFFNELRFAGNALFNTAAVALIKGIAVNTNSRKSSQPSLWSTVVRKKSPPQAGMVCS